MQSLILASVILASSGTVLSDGSTFIPAGSALASQLNNILPYTSSGFSLTAGGYTTKHQGALVQPPLETAELITCSTKAIFTRTQNSTIFQGCTIVTTDVVPEGAATFTFAEFLLLLADQPAS